MAALQRKQPSAPILGQSGLAILVCRSPDELLYSQAVVRNYSYSLGNSGRKILHFDRLGALLKINRLQADFALLKPLS
jgi:hypothetical protein